MIKKGRVFILMLDSFGLGGAQDAAVFGDEGANTFGHIAAAVGKIDLPNLSALGLLQAAQASAGVLPPVGPQRAAQLTLPSKYGFMREQSSGKDTSSGHWEMAGAPVNFEWGYFPPQYPSFPAELVRALCQQAGLPGILGNKAASGTEIINELGEEHIRTGKPIYYTSADSVFQIAAHEKYFGLDKLYALCQTAFELVRPYRIARVIARPFEGTANGSFTRTKNRRDFSVQPPEPTVLDAIKNAGGQVISVGKIADIFAGQGITRAVKASGLEELWNVTIREGKTAAPGSLIFTNFVDFDMVWGHRRDSRGYADGLAYFDSRLPDLQQIMQPEDIAFITADHGCDPTFKGSDHTRENVPVILFGQRVKVENLGGRNSFADLGQTVAAYFNLPPLKHGTSFLDADSGF